MEDNGGYTGFTQHSHRSDANIMCIDITDCTGRITSSESAVGTYYGQLPKAFNVPVNT